MYEINKIYRQHVYDQLVTTSKNEILNKEKIENKVLSFFGELGLLCQETDVSGYYNMNAIDHQAVLDAFTDGLGVLLSLAFELKIESIKNYTEIPSDISLSTQFLKLYHQGLKILATYQFEDYQDCIDDYLTLGFKLGLSFDEIIEHYTSIY